MKYWLRLLACAALCLLFAAPALGEDITLPHWVGDYYCYYDDGFGGMCITDYQGSAADLVVPDTLEGYPVRSIAYAAFEGCETLVTVRLPDTLTDFCGGAFIGNSALTDVWLPENLATFSEPSLPNDAVFHVGRRSASAKLMAQDTKNPTRRFIDPELPDFILAYKTGADGSAELGLSRYTGAETTVALPDDIEHLFYDAFADCSHLTSVTLPSGLKSFFGESFSGCTNLTVALPENITEIHDLFVASCRFYVSKDSRTAKLFAVPAGTYPNRFTDPALPDMQLYMVEGENGSAELGLFKYAGTEETIRIPDGFAHIYMQAFSVMDGGDALPAKTIIMPDSVVSVGTNAFLNLPSLKELHLPPNITSFGDGIVGYNPELVIYCSLNSTSAQHITSSVLYRGKGITDPDNPDFAVGFDENGAVLLGYSGAGGHVAVPESIKSIGFAAFENNHGVTSVTLPDGLVAIGERAFSGTQRLTSINIPSTVREIGAYAFDIDWTAYNENPASARGLTLILPDTVETIGARAFPVLAGVYPVCTHGSVTAAAFEAVNDALGLPENAYIDPRWPGYLIGRMGGKTYACGYVGENPEMNIPPVFDVIAECFSANTPHKATIGSITIPEGVTKLEARCFMSVWASSLTLPSTLRTIGTRALDGPGLTYLTIPEGMKKLPENLYTGSLEALVLPRSLTSIHENAFLKNRKVDGKLDERIGVIFCYEDSYAAQWAEQRAYQQVVYLDDTSGGIVFPDGLSADVGTRVNWREKLFIATDMPESGYTIKVTSSDKAVVAVSGDELVCKEPGLVQLTFSSAELGAKCKVDFFAHAPVESFSLPEYAFRKVGSSQVKFTVSDVVPAKNTYDQYTWVRQNVDAVRDRFIFVEDVCAFNRPADPTVYTMTVTARSGVTREMTLVFYKNISKVSFSAFTGTYLVGDIIQPSISVTIDGRVYKDNRYTYTLTSSDPAIAKVTSKGKLQLLAPGTATITCEAMDGTVIKRKITVLDKQIYTLPKALTVVEEEAFRGCPAQVIVIPDGCIEIGAYAFADCAKLESITIPASVTKIAETAFDGCPADFAIDAPAGSAAEAYAAAHGYAK